MGDILECGFQESGILSGIGEVSKKLEKEAITTQEEVTEKKNCREQLDRSAIESEEVKRHRLGDVRKAFRHVVREALANGNDGASHQSPVGHLSCAPDSV